MWVVSRRKRKSHLCGGVALKDWRYVPSCHCHRCAAERVVWRPLMARLTA